MALAGLGSACTNSRTHTREPWAVAAPATYRALAAGADALASGAAIQTIGEGRYAYRFILTDPGSGDVLPQTPFALGATVHLPFVADRKNMYQGVSDAQGMTPVFRMEHRLADAEWTFLRRFGSGPFGETFRIRGPGGEPMAGVAYVVTVCSKPVGAFRGTTDADGNSAYFVTPTATTIEFHYDFGTFETEPTDETAAATSKDAKGDETIIPDGACSTPESGSVRKETTG